MTKQLLRALSRPARVNTLAERLGVEPGTLVAMLEVLEAKGYVVRAYEGSPHCPPSCASCAIRSLCPAAFAPAAAPTTWRLTEKERRAVN